MLHAHARLTVIRTSVPLCRLVWAFFCANIWDVTAVGGGFVGVDQWGIGSQSTTLPPEAEFFLVNSRFSSKNGFAVKKNCHF